MNHAKRQQNARKKQKEKQQRYLALCEEYTEFLIRLSPTTQQILSNKHLENPIDYGPILHQRMLDLRTFKNRFSNFKNQKH